MEPESPDTAKPDPPTKILPSVCTAIELTTPPALRPTVLGKLVSTVPLLLRRAIRNTECAPYRNCATDQDVSGVQMAMVLTSP